jgi:hypothetical protein
MLGAAAWPLRAQSRGDNIDIRLPSRGAASEGPLVAAIGILGDAQLRDLLRNGFPVHVHYRTELWSAGRWFNELQNSYEWDAVIRYDQLDHTYEVVRIVGDQVTPLGEYTQYSAAQAAAERLYRVPIGAPPRGRRSFYSVVIDVETLSLSDLDELERWLRGELRPSLQGRRNPGTALGRGARTLMARMLGAETRHYERRSGTFRD